MNDNLFMAQLNWVKESSKVHIKKQIIDQQDTRVLNYLHSPKAQIWKISHHAILCCSCSIEAVEHDHVESFPSI